MQLTNCFISVGYYPLPDVTSNAMGFPMQGDENLELTMAEELARACWFEGKVKPHPVIVDMIAAAIMAARFAANPEHKPSPAPEGYKPLAITPGVKAALEQLNAALGA